MAKLAMGLQEKQQHPKVPPVQRSVDPHAMPPNAIAEIADAQLPAIIINEDPRITVVPNFLSREECAHLIELTNERFECSKTWGLGEGKLKAETAPLRTSSTGVIDFGETSVVRNVENRVSQLAGISLGHLEKLACVRYKPGEFYKAHHDGHWRPKTIFVYLNDLPDSDEGETNFIHLGLKIVPRAGTAVMWANTFADGQADQRTMHQGLPPKSVIKYGLNCFFGLDNRRGRVMAQQQLASAQASFPKQMGSPVAGCASRKPHVGPRRDCALSPRAVARVPSPNESWASPLRLRVAKEPHAAHAMTSTGTSVSIAASQGHAKPLPHLLPASLTVDRTSADMTGAFYFSEKIAKPGRPLPNLLSPSLQVEKIAAPVGAQHCAALSAPVVIPVPWATVPTRPIMVP